MKSAMTPQCKICMVERKEILHRKREDKNKIINDNSDIFSSCKCKCRFHKFGRYLHVETLRTRLPQKKSTLLELPSQNETDSASICLHRNIANPPMRRRQSHLNRRLLKRRPRDAGFFNRHQCAWPSLEGSVGKSNQLRTCSSSRIPTVPGRSSSSLA